MRFKGEFKVESLAFVAFLVTVPFYSPNLVPFNALDADAAYLPLFVSVLLGLVAVAGLVVAGVSFRRPDRGSHVPVLAAACLSYGAGAGLLFAGLVAGWPPEAVSLGAAVLCAAGVVPLGLAWGRYFSSFGLAQALVHAVALGGIAALLGLMLTSLSGAVLMATYFILLVVGCCVPLARAVLKLDQAVVLDAPQPVGVRAAWLNFLSVAGESLLGLLLFAFIMAVRKFVLFESFHAENIGGLVAAALVVPLCLRRADQPLMSFAFRWYLPVCALVLVVLDSFPVGSPPNTLGAFGIYAFLTLVALVAASSLVAASHAREFAPSFVFALTMGLFCLVSLAGIWVGALPGIADDPGPLLLVLSTAYLAFLLFSAMRTAWKREGPHDRIAGGNEFGAAHGSPSSGKTALPVGASSGADAERVGGALRTETPLRVDAVELRRAALAKRAELSPREAEILGYVGRGYAPAYIARTLVLSESTVRTHVRHIYKKLGVTSREECLDLMNG